MSNPRRALSRTGSATATEGAAARRSKATESSRRPSPVSAFVRRVAVPMLAVSLVTGGAALTLLPDSGGTAVPAADPDVTLRTARSSVRTPLPEFSDSSDPGRAASPANSPSQAATLSPAAAPVAGVDGLAASTTAATTSEQTPEPVETPAQPSYPTALAADAGTLYARTSVNVRKGPGTDFAVLDTLATAAAVHVTEASFDGWRQVSLDGTAGWVKASYLVKTKPEVPSSGGSGSSSGGIDTSPCSRASGAEDGLTARTVDVLRAVCNAFPAVKSFGGARAGSGSYHNSGQAVDVMISGDAGWAVAKWARANASSLGIIEVLYAQKIWTTQRSDEGWRGFSDRGSDTANHYDHVHISVR